MQAIPARVSLAMAQSAGRAARISGKPFTARFYGPGMLESQAYAAGWRFADFDVKHGIPATPAPR